MSNRPTMEDEMSAVSGRIGKFSRELCMQYDVRAVAAIWFAEGGLLMRAMLASKAIPSAQIGELLLLQMEAAMSDDNGKTHVVYGPPSERAS